MKNHSIERKIMIPFLIIVLLPTLLISVVSMWFSYQSEKQQTEQLVHDTLKNISSSLEILNEQVIAGELTEDKAKELARAFIYELEGFYLEENGVYTTQGERITENQLSWLTYGELDQQPKSLLRERAVYMKELPDWSWRLYVPLEFSIFTGPLPTIQKYTLLIIMITSVIAVEVTIIFSYYLSKPIKNLAEFCRQISQHGKPITEIRMRKERKDEIGVLSRSLTEMVERLEQRNLEINRMKQINERILNSVHVGMILVSEYKHQWIYNEAARKMVAQNPILNEKITQLTQPDLIFYNKEELWNIKVAEKNVYYIVHIESFESIEEKYSLLLTIEDITERKKVEERLERIHRLASLGEMASGIAHEIRNPLAGIKTTTQVLMRRLDLSQGNATLMESIVSEVDRVNKIITNVLQFSRPIGPVPENVNLANLVNSVFLLMEGVAEKHQVKLVKKEIDDQVKVDRDQLRQIILNLIINGIHAMPEGGELTVSSMRKEAEIVICISDTGVGMEEEVIQKIFNPFFTTRPEGTGLGLSVVHQLVVQNEGEIELESTVGKGTTFYITLPSGEEG